MGVLQMQAYAEVVNNKYASVAIYLKLVITDVLINYGIFSTTEIYSNPVESRVVLTRGISLAPSGLCL